MGCLEYIYIYIFTCFFPMWIYTFLPSYFHVKNIWFLNSRYRGGEVVHCSWGARLASYHPVPKGGWVSSPLFPPHAGIGHRTPSREAVLNRGEGWTSNFCKQRGGKGNTKQDHTQELTGPSSLNLPLVPPSGLLLLGAIALWFHVRSWAWWRFNGHRPAGLGPRRPLKLWRLTWWCL